MEKVNPGGFTPKLNLHGVMNLARVYMQISTRGEFLLSLLLLLFSKFVFNLT